MAEALGVAASVIAVIQLSEQVISACYQCFTTAKDAQKDILNTINVISGLKSTLDNLQVLLNRNDPRLSKHSFAGGLKACDDTLRQLSKKLGVSESIGVRKRLTWPWTRGQVEQELETIEKHKTTFILALADATLQVSLSMGDSVNRISRTVESLFIDHKTSRVLAWLNPGDPSANHERARDRHQPTTGDWFLKSEVFDTWTKSTNTSIWLRGIPGAGKTILCSTIVEHIRTFHSEAQYIYFYLDFTDHQQTVVWMLGSLIKQLCLSRAKLPDQVSELYNRCKDGEKPKKRHLMETLLGLLRGKTFIMIDALDECKAHEELLDVITEISKNGNLLVTSRNEKWIADRLIGLVGTTVTLSGRGVDADIELYVQTRLTNDIKLRKWPPNQKEIRDAVIKGAHGMHSGLRSF